LAFRLLIGGLRMADLLNLPNELDAQKYTCKVIIETPKGSRNKFAYHQKSRLFELRGLLPHGLVFPFDFGFIPRTLGGDGDPLDVMVLMDSPAHVGCLIDIRVIGILNAEQSKDGEKQANDRLLGVASQTYDFERVAAIDDLDDALLAQVEEFFISWAKQRGKKFAITGRGGPQKAVRYLEAGIRAYRGKQNKRSGG